MKHFIGFSLALAGVLLAVPTSAQQVPPRATAFATAPDIPDQSVPNFLTIPPNLYLGEGIGVARNSKGHIFIFTRSGDTRLFEFDQNGKFVREIGQGLYGFEIRARGARRLAGQHLGGGRRHQHGHQVQPRRARLMVLGRRPEAVDGLFGPSTGRRAGPWRAVPLRSPDGRRVGPAGQHLRLRRLRQLARRQVRQERPLRRSRSGTRGTEPGPVQHAALDRGRRQGQHLRRRSRQRAHSGVRQRPDAASAIYDNVGSPWAVCISPGPHQYLFSSNSNPDNNNSLRRGGHRRDLQDGAGRHDHRQVRQGGQSNSASSARCTRSTAATPTSSSSPRSPRGACRRFCLKPITPHRRR